MENSHPAVNSQYVVSPHHSPWEFNASSLPLRSPPPPPPFFPVLFSSFHCISPIVFLPAKLFLKVPSIFRSLDDYLYSVKWRTT